MCNFKHLLICKHLLNGDVAIVHKTIFIVIFKKLVLNNFECYSMCNKCHRCAFVTFSLFSCLYVGKPKRFHTSDFKHAGEFSQTLLLVIPSLLALSATFAPLLDVDKRAERKR